MYRIVERGRGQRDGLEVCIAKRPEGQRDLARPPESRIERYRAENGPGSERKSEAKLDDRRRERASLGRAIRGVVQECEHDVTGGKVYAESS